MSIPPRITAVADSPLVSGGPISSPPQRNDDVAQLYAREWAALTARAHITSFLPILVTRKVRAILRQR